MLQMLPKMVGAEELLRLVALSEFVYVVQVLGADIPLWWIGELLATVATEIGASRRLRGVESGLYACENRATPTMPTQMEGILVSFGFILVLEAIRTIRTRVLFL
jgi:hypothetical protein